MSPFSAESSKRREKSHLLTLILTHIPGRCGNRYALRRSVSQVGIVHGIEKRNMGFFIHPLSRGGSSIQPATPKVSKGLFDQNDALLLAPVKGSESSSLECNKNKRSYLSQRFWNIMQTPRGTSSATTSNLQMMQLESDTDWSMSPFDEWENENDHVNLLPQKTPTNARFEIFPSDSKGLKSSSPPQLVVATTPDFALQKQISELVTTNGISAHKNWNRSCSTKSGKNCSKSKKCRKEIEIQFECFLEDDESSSLPSLSTVPTMAKKSVKPTFTRRTKSVQSWLAQTFGAVKKGYMMTVNPNYRKSGEPRDNITESSGDCDAEDEIQIIFDRKNVVECTGEYMFKGSHSIDDDVTISFIHSLIWENEAPIQFSIPENAIKPMYFGEYNEDHHLIHDDKLGVMNGPKPVLMPIV